MTSLPKNEASANASTSSAVVVDSSSFNKYNNLLPKEVTHADSMSVDEVKKKWNELYVAAGVGSGDENKKMSFRIWAYVQACLNGTSRSGDYKTKDKLSDGTAVESAVIPRVLGRDIRKFFRGNMEESYKVLKTTGVMTTYPRFVKRCAEMGVNADECFATADWLDDCPMFTPTETSAHAKSFAVGLIRASRARNGKTLERVEDEALAVSIRANGPDARENVAAGDVVDF